MTLTLKMADIEYDAFEAGFDKGREDGLRQGIEQGAYENKLETARKLIARGYSPEEIADLSGLTIYQVQSLLVDSEQP